MSKKNRANPATDLPTNAETAAATEPSSGSNPVPVARPSTYVEIDGIQYKFDKRDLPKRGDVEGTITVDGTPSNLKVTSNKGWAKTEADVLEYAWFTLADGTPGYITGNYAEPILPLVAGKTATKGTGKANRANPARIGVEEREAKRIALFKVTYAARNPSKAVTESTTEPTATEQAE
jgi:hypothetical protein